MAKNRDMPDANQSFIPESVYKIRRRNGLIAILVIVLLGQFAGANILGVFKERPITSLNSVFNAFPDEAFGILIDNGKVSPAPHDEILAWIELAHNNGNTEPTGELVYVLANTYVFQDGTTLPNGMAGAHARMFLVRHGQSLPKNARESHNTYMFAETGTCLGVMTGCAFF